MDIECKPIVSLKELYIYETPRWTELIKPLIAHKEWCISGVNLNCHTKEKEWRAPVRMRRGFVPKTLICHDMAGGYLHDRHCRGVDNVQGYTFYNWGGIDMFIYFSHNLITIPPLGWINAAHIHGVQILGTIITEWTEGEKITSEILKSKESVEKFSNAIVSLTKTFRLDGWLLNIENKVTETEMLNFLLQDLTHKLHEKCPNSVLLWYDSVTADGTLKWQNELNSLNRCWFDACDGIFLNYNWTHDQLQASAKMAGHRILDVFVGIDVFARNCIGKMDTAKPLEVIRKNGLSAAIFAPGWTYETMTKQPDETYQQSFYARDYVFWKQLQEFLYFHGPTQEFVTFFGTGVSSNHYDINKQDLQLTVLPFGGYWSKEDGLSEDRSFCMCLKRYIEYRAVPHGCSLQLFSSSVDHLHKLMHCEIRCTNRFLIGVWSKRVHPTDDIRMDLKLMLQNKNGRFQIFTLYGSLADKSESELSIYPTAASSEHKSVPELLNETWQQKFYTVNINDATLLEIAAVLSNIGAYFLGGLSVATS